MIILFHIVTLWKIGQSLDWLTQGLNVIEPMGLLSPGWPLLRQLLWFQASIIKAEQSIGGQ